METPLNALRDTMDLGEKGGTHRSTCRSFQVPMRKTESLATSYTVQYTVLEATSYTAKVFGRKVILQDLEESTKFYETFSLWYCLQ